MSLGFPRGSCFIVLPMETGDAVLEIGKAGTLRQYFCISWKRQQSPGNTEIDRRLLSNFFSVIRIILNVLHKLSQHNNKRSNRDLNGYWASAPRQLSGTPSFLQASQVTTLPLTRIPTVLPLHLNHTHSSLALSHTLLEILKIRSLLTAANLV